MTDGSTLEGKVVLVTGAAAERGIGRGIALVLAERGADVVVNDIADEDRAAPVRLDGHLRRDEACRTDAAAFLDRSRAFVDELGTAVREGVAEGIVDLWALTRRAAERVGPYPEPIAELAASVRAHLALV